MKKIKPSELPGFRNSPSKAKLLALSLCVGLIPMVTMDSNAAVTVNGNANTHAEGSGGSGSPSDTESLVLGLGTVASSAARNTEFDSYGGSSSVNFNVVDLAGVVTITGSLSSSASAQTFDNPVTASSYANLLATVSLDQPYSYEFTWDGSASSGTATVGFDDLTDSAIDSGSFSHIDTGLLSAGDYSLSAAVASGAASDGWNTASGNGSASFTLELTPSGSEVPEVGSGVIAGAAMLVLSGLQFFRRQKRQA